MTTMDAAKISPPTSALRDPADALGRKYPDQPRGPLGRRFVLLGLRATLVAKADGCAHCREYHGLRFNPLDGPLSETSTSTSLAARWSSSTWAVSNSSRFKRVLSGNSITVTWLLVTP